MNLEELDALSQKVAKALYIIENLKLERTSLSQRAETAEQQLESKEAELQEQVLKIEEQALKIEEQASQLEEQTTQIESLNNQLEEGNTAQAAILSEAQERLQGMLTALDSLDFDPATETSETTESDEVVEPAMESEVEPAGEDESYEQDPPAHESIELESMEEPSVETASVEVEPTITDAGDLFGQLDQVILESEQSEAPEGEFVETTLTGEQVSEEVPQFVEETYETYQLEEEESPEPSAQYETEEVLEVPTYHQNSETTEEWTDDWDEEVAPRHNEGPSIQEDSVYSEDEN